MNEDAVRERLFAELAQLLEEYGLPPTGEGALATEGRDNVNVIVPTRDGRVVVRLYRRTRREDVGFELDVVEHLHAGGYPVPTLRRRRGGERLAFVGDHPVAVFEFVEGVHPSPYDPETLERVGVWLAEYHAAVAGFLPESSKEYGELTELERARDLAPRFRELGYDDFLGDLAAFERRELPDVAALLERVPTGVIHSDFRPDNLLVEDGTLNAVLDFDTSYVGSFVRDLAETLIIWSMPEQQLEPDLEAVASVGEAYRRARAPADDERTLLRGSLLLACLSDAVRYLADRLDEGDPAASALECTMYRRYLVLAGAVDDVVAATLAAP